MAKTLCELKKLPKENPALFIPLVNKPRFLCAKCGRVANKKRTFASRKKCPNR